MRATKIQRLAIGAAGAAALVVAGAGAANAHVTVSPGEAVAGSYAVLAFAVPHGCDGSATTEIAIQIPEETPSVTPSVNPNWDVEKVMVELDEPVTDAHGNELTERVGEIVYTAKTPLPDELRDAFELSIPMPDTPGETLVYPVVQTCEQGETAWVQVADEGEDAHALDEPAPFVTLTEPAGEDDSGVEEASDTSDSGEGSDAAADAGAAADAATDDDGGSGNGLAVAGLATGVLGILVGGTALVRTRRQT